MHSLAVQAEEEVAAAEARERRKRERAAEETLAKAAAEADARRAGAALREAMAAFKTLLQEHVRAADADWKHWLPRLEKDPQARPMTYTPVTNCPLAAQRPIPRGKKCAKVEEF